MVLASYFPIKSNTHTNSDIKTRTNTITYNLVNNLDDSHIICSIVKDETTKKTLKEILYSYDYEGNKKRVEIHNYKSNLETIQYYNHGKILREETTYINDDFKKIVFYNDSGDISKAEFDTGLDGSIDVVLDSQRFELKDCNRKYMSNNNIKDYLNN